MLNLDFFFSLYLNLVCETYLMLTCIIKEFFSALNIHMVKISIPHLPDHSIINLVEIALDKKQTQVLFS